MTDPQEGATAPTPRGTTPSDLHRSAAGASEPSRPPVTAVPAAEQPFSAAQKPRSILIFGRRMPLPASRGWRIVLGIALVLGGILGFLPILGLWMLPLGLLVLSVDLVFVRRWRRRTAIRWGRWRRSRRQATVIEGADRL